MMWLLMVTRSGVAVDVVAGNTCGDELCGGNDHWKTSRKPEDKAFEGLCRRVLMLHIFEVERQVWAPDMSLTGHITLFLSCKMSTRRVMMRVSDVDDDTGSGDKDGD